MAHFPGWLENKFRSNLQYPSVTTNHLSNNGLVYEQFVLMYRCSISDRKTEAQHMDNASLRNLPLLIWKWIKTAGWCPFHQFFFLKIECYIILLKQYLMVISVEAISLS